METTVVVFRRWREKGGTVFALFPLDVEGPGLVSSFEHVGQHSAANYAGCIARSRPVTPAEYADLKRELESKPYEYCLDVRRRCWPGYSRAD